MLSNGIEILNYHSNTEPATINTCENNENLRKKLKDMEKKTEEHGHTAIPQKVRTFGRWWRKEKSGSISFGGFLKYGYPQIMYF